MHLFLRQCQIQLQLIQAQLVKKKKPVLPVREVEREKNAVPHTTLHYHSKQC